MKHMNMAVSWKSVKAEFVKQVIIAAVVALAVLFGTGFVGVSHDGYTTYPTNVHVQTTTFHVGGHSWELVKTTENETQNSSFTFQTAMNS